MVHTYVHTYIHTQCDLKLFALNWTYYTLDRIGQGMANDLVNNLTGTPLDALDGPTRGKAACTSL